jgi:hypothetical protein
VKRSRRRGMRVERVPFSTSIFQKRRPPDFKNFDKASPLLFDFREQSVAQALSKRRLDRSYLCPTNFSSPK